MTKIWKGPLCGDMEGNPEKIIQGGKEGTNRSILEKYYVRKIFFRWHGKEAGLKGIDL
ncbi:MAG: hypothetical protein MUO24_02305 [Desulfobacterales bacterium]|nr:hypothetical protein [Desulfobacterales bacterium]